MDTGKTHCDVCETDITLSNYSRHIKSKKHLQNILIKNNELNKLIEWAKVNHIYRYKNLNKQELKNIKKNFNKEDYNLFDDEKLNQIGKKLYVRNLENIDRTELINRLEKIQIIYH